MKQLGQPDKRSPSTNIFLEAKNGLTFDPYTISEVFKKLFSNLANHYYNDMFNLNPKKLTFQTIQTRYISDLIKNCDINKTAGNDDLSSRFLKDGADILTIPITQFCK